jgi:hypothetical protein
MCNRRRDEKYALTNICAMQQNLTMCQHRNEKKNTTTYKHNDEKISTLFIISHM